MTAALDIASPLSRANQKALIRAVNALERQLRRADRRLCRRPHQQGGAVVAASGEP
jgi:ribosome-associated translation inhibitor RaiA